MSRKVYKDVKVFKWYTAASKTETENGVGINVQNYKIAQFFLKVTDWVTLTSLDVKFQTQDPNTEDWFDLGIAFTQLTDAGTEMIISVLVDVTTDKAYAHVIPLGQKIRPVITIVGSGSAKVNLSMIAKS